MGVSYPARLMMTFHIFRRYATVVVKRQTPLLMDPVKVQQMIDKTPYFVERTRIGKSLPVYTDYRKQGQRVFTIIRRIYGSIQTLHGDLKNFLPKNVPTEVRVDLLQIRVKGDQSENIRKFLTLKGF